jgi:hypothetical protein
MQRLWPGRAYWAPDDKTPGAKKWKDTERPEKGPPVDERFVDVGLGMDEDVGRNTGGKGTLGIVDGDNVPGAEGGG